jgi:FAD/FMN-containing dehydrogenase
VADERIDRRAFVLRGAAAGSALYLAACGSSGVSTTTRALRKRALPKATGASLGDLEHAVRGAVLTPKSSAFGSAAEVYNQRYDGAKPLAIVRPKDTADVSAALKWAAKRDVRVLPRSGGHSYGGYSTGDGVMVVDLAGMSSVKFDHGSGTAEVEAGAQLIDVYLELAKHGVTIPAGSCPSVGAGGHVLGGGMGFAGRRLGMAADNLREVTIVTADGERRVADSTSENDLFWACRGGGGGNFGVTTKFKLNVHQAHSAAHFNISWPFAQAAQALDAWQSVIPEATRDLTAVFRLAAGGSSPAVGTSGQYFGPVSNLPHLLSELISIPGASLSTGTLDYAELMLFWAGCSSLSEAACHTVGTHPGGTFPRERFLAKSDYVGRKLNAKGRDALVKAIERRQANLGGGSGAILLDSYGGAINDVPAAATAFVHRDELFCIQYLAYFPESGTKTAKKWAERTWKSMRTHVSGAAYQNYIDPELAGWENAYYGHNYARLQQVKKQYDPDFRFRFAQAIRPAA